MPRPAPKKKLPIAAAMAMIDGMLNSARCRSAGHS